MGVNQSGSSSGKILQENLAENSCRKILWENLTGNSCGKFLCENPVVNSCRIILREMVVGKSCSKSFGKILPENLRKAVIGGNLAFGIGRWGVNQLGSRSGKYCGKILQGNIAGISCGKFMREILVGKSCGKFLQENPTGNCCGKLLPVRDLKMAKNANIGNFFTCFLLFLGSLQAIKHHQTTFFL